MTCQNIHLECREKESLNQSDLRELSYFTLCYLVMNTAKNFPCSCWYSFNYGTANCTSIVRTYVAYYSTSIARVYVDMMDVTHVAIAIWARTYIRAFVHGPGQILISDNH